MSRIDVRSAEILYDEPGSQRVVLYRLNARNGDVVDMRPHFASVAAARGLFHDRGTSSTIVPVPDRYPDVVLNFETLPNEPRVGAVWLLVSGAGA